MRLVPALATLALLGACSRSAPAPAGEPAGGTPSAQAAAPAAGTAGGERAYVSSVTTLRREASDAARVRGPASKELSNVLATLHRGERVTLLELREDWARVRASDDAEGWLKRGALLEGEGITEATVLVPADVFDRPDLLAANARRKIDAGTLVLVVRTRAPFAEVNVAGGQNAWVLSERLASGEREVSVAKLAEKARWLVRVNRKEEALQILALAREHFAGVALVDSLAAELGEVPAAQEGGAIVPAAGAAPPAGEAGAAPAAQ